MEFEFAEVEFRQDNNNTPFSPLFDDYYFSISGGVEEAEHVFIKGNNLLKRDYPLTIVEFGFGTALNFLTTFKYLRPSAYISFEKYPLKRSDLIRCVEYQPKLRDLAFTKKFLGLYHPERFKLGINHFPEVNLTLIIGDLEDNFTLLDSLDSLNLVDAWYLDGFSPQKNKALWSQKLFEKMRELSAPGATFATYSSAGFVRRGLQQAGFRINKVAGVGGKREILVGSCSS